MTAFISTLEGKEDWKGELIYEPMQRIVNVAGTMAGYASSEGWTWTQGAKTRYDEEELLRGSAYAATC
jgi:hypothetical protein